MDRLPQAKRGLEELIKGSYDYLMAMIRSAFYHQFRADEADYYDRPWFYIEEIFQGYVIVRAEDLPPDEFYLVTYAQDAGGGYVFAERDDWEVVELAYRMPAAAVDEGKRERRRVELAEAITGLTLGELVDAATGARRITGYGITADVVNANERRYRRPVLERALADAKLRRGQLGARAVVGEDQHPSDKGQRAQWLETIIRWDDWAIEADGRTRLEGVVIPTSKGRDAITLLEHDVFPGLSQRAYGYAELVSEGGRQIEEITELVIVGYDTVMEPSDPNGAITALLESARSAAAQHIPPRAPAAPPRTTTPTNGGTRPMEITIEMLRAQYPELVTQILSEADQANRERKLDELRQRYLLDDAARKARETAEAEAKKRLDAIEEERAKERQELQRLQEAERQRTIAAHVAEKARGLKGYSEAARDALVADVVADAPKTTDEADALLARRQKVLDAALAQSQLAATGYRPAGQPASGTLQVVGPVIEQATGQPAYARGAMEISEALRKRGYAKTPELPQTRAALYAEALLTRFDQLHEGHLAREARAIEEALGTADINIPYSTMRAVIAQVTPMLMAAEVFDLGVIDTDPTRVYYETFSYETGAQPTVTDEAVTADLGNWVALANKRVNVGSVVVTSSPAGTTYVEGTDYVIDYENGQLKAIATITDNQNLLVDYTYQAMRKGEGASIERGKLGLGFVTLSTAADRLAAQINREAQVYSQAQIGWDATTRTLNALIERIQRKIDQDAFMHGLMAALQVASNSGGTWTAASNTIADLVAKIGVAKLKVQNRFYEPSAILMSKTNEDRLTNPENNFHIFGAAGVGRGNDGRLTVKGLPVFGTTNFRDDYILVTHRELVMHRTFQPMQLFGPFPTYDSGELVAAEQYYVEQFSGSVSPIKEKGSYVKVA